MKINRYNWESKQLWSDTLRRIVNYDAVGYQNIPNALVAQNYGFLTTSVDTNRSSEVYKILKINYALLGHKQNTIQNDKIENKKEKVNKFQFYNQTTFTELNVLYLALYILPELCFSKKIIFSVVCMNKQYNFTIIDLCNLLKIGPRLEVYEIEKFLSVFQINTDQQPSMRHLVSLRVENLKNEVSNRKR